MKCSCEECRGDGTITCPECDGQGTVEGSIEIISLRPNLKNFDDLMEVQRDAKRVIRQAERLKSLIPHRSDSYEAQLKATLFVINAEADAIAAKNK